MNIQESQITGLRPVLWHNHVAALLALLVEPGALMGSW